MILHLKKHIKWESAILFAAALFVFASCMPKTEFELSGNDKTVSMYNLDTSFSLKLSEAESEKFVSLINGSELTKVAYDDVAGSDYNEMSCIFLNADSAVYAVMQSAGDDSEFCIKTHEDELSDEDITPSAYTFSSEELAEFITAHKQNAVMPTGYTGEILSVDENNTDIILVSPDGQQEVDLNGNWVFKTIVSQGSGEPGARALDYGMYSSCWGNAIVFNPDGTGIMIYAYASENPLYEEITWNYLSEGGRKTGLVYGNSGFGFMLKFTGAKDGNPLFEMTDAKGGDDGYGADFIRTAELERFVACNCDEFEHIIGIDISGIDEINVNYRGHMTAINSSDEIQSIISALKSIGVSPAGASYEDAEHIYTFDLVSGGKTDLKIGTDTTGKWLEVGGNYYDISEPESFIPAKNTLETYISFGQEPVEKKDYIRAIISEIIQTNINRSEVRWSHFPKESYRAEHWQDEDFLEHWAYQEKALSQDDVDYIINTLPETDFEILDKQSVVNTDFHIGLDFENDSVISLAADDSEIYMNLRYNGEWIYAKVLHIDLFEYLLGFAGEGGFDMEWISDTESVTLCYVKKADRKDYPENGRITEIEITDADTVMAITDALMGHASQTMTYPSRESSDIIFHGPDGDHYGKIKFPITTDENGIAEPTIIMEGYYWYSCEELYKILIEIENAQ